MTSPIGIFFFLTIAFSLLLGFLDLNWMRGILHTPATYAPPYLSYPWLYSIWKATSLSAQVLMLPKVLFERFFFLWPIVGIVPVFFLRKSIHFYKVLIYYILGIVLSVYYILALMEGNTTFLLYLYSVPAIIYFYLLFYSYFLHLLCILFPSSFSQILWMESLPDFSSVLEIFLSSYGKMFVFIYVLGVGPDIFPINEVDIYTMKFGEDRAWLILTFRNLFLDALFFSLMFIYPIVIMQKPSIPWKEAFREVKNFWKPKLGKVLATICIYYISLILLHHLFQKPLVESVLFSYTFSAFLSLVYFTFTAKYLYKIILK